MAAACKLLSFASVILAVSPCCLSFVLFMVVKKLGLTYRRNAAEAESTVTLGVGEGNMPQTIAKHREPGQRWNLTSVQGGSTLPNLLEPLSSRGNKDHRVIALEFGVVQLF